MTISNVLLVAGFLLFVFAAVLWIVVEPYHHHRIRLIAAGLACITLADLLKSGGIH